MNGRVLNTRGSTRVYARLHRIFIGSSRKNIGLSSNYLNVPGSVCWDIAMSSLLSIMFATSKRHILPLFCLKYKVFELAYFCAKL